MRRFAPKGAKFHPTGKKRTTVLYGGIAIIAVLLVLAFIFVGQPRPLSRDIGDSGLDPSIPRGRTAEGLPYLGENDAPVTILEYEDFGCPNCQEFVLDVEPRLIEEYIRDGKVRLVSFPVAFVNVHSLPGAEAAVCAAEQERYWEYRHLLFANQGVLAFNRNNLIDIAREAELDLISFVNCFDQRRYRDLVIERTRSAQASGIAGTPTFEMGGERFEGLLKYDSPDPGNPGLVQIIEGIIASN